jgi:hypothetical protein
VSLYKGVSETSGVNDHHDHAAAAAAADVMSCGVNS